MTTDRFSSPGLWNRFISGCSSALTVSCVNEWLWVPSSSSQVFQMPATAYGVLLAISIAQRTCCDCSQLGSNTAMQGTRHNFEVAQAFLYVRSWPTVSLRAFIVVNRWPGGIRRFGTNP